jgi:hypothetical protein
MSMEQPHAHMGSQWSQFPLSSSTSASVSASACSSPRLFTIPAFSRRPVPLYTSIYVHHLPRIFVLPQYTLVIPSCSLHINRMSMEEPHAQMGSQRSQYQLFRRLLLRLVLLFACSPILASSRRLVPLHQVLRQHINLVSSPMDSLFSSFRIHGIAVANPRHESPGLSLSADH